MPAHRDQFWTLPLSELTPGEWEALCDGCGKCCLNKLEDADTGEVHFTRISCKLLDTDTCRCTKYETRLQYVPECVVLSPKSLPDVAYFMPASCAYRLRHEDKPLPDWHPLRTGDTNSTRAAGASVAGWAISEETVDEDDWEFYLIEEET
ncbi:MAG: hypothetical protein CR993_07395 [Rhodobacterales bacterium]|nr:MAG: hypothetical protein CR993_07395 [Rhodobacterales bacterium]